MKENKFLKDFTKFFSGTIIAQIIAFAVSPILSRLYLPEDFGYFTLFSQFLAVALIFSGSSLFYLLPRFKTEQLAQMVFSIIIRTSMLISIFIFVISFFDLSGNEQLITLWPYLIFGVFLNNIYALFHFQSIAKEDFVTNSVSKVHERLVGSTSNIGLGYIGWNGVGLILGNFVGQLIFCLSFLRKGYGKLLTLNSTEKINFLKKHKKHISFQSLNHLLEYGLVLGFSLLITEFSSIKELGYFAFCYKIINTPLNLISDYIGQAMLGRISDFQDNHHRRLFLIKILALLCLPSVIGIALFHFYGPEIFMLVFGGGWRVSGEISQVYILGIIATFIIRSLQYVPNVVNKHEVYSFFSFFTFGLPVFTLVYANNIGISFIASLEKLSYALAALALVYVISLFVLFSKNNNQ